MALIDLSGIDKSYGKDDYLTPVLFGVDLKIEKGEFVAMMGPSGSGKSTLMNIIGLLDKASNGTYKLENRNVAQYKDSELSQLRGQKIGFVFQSFNLLPRLTAFENVQLPLLYSHMNSQDRKQRTYEILEKVGLADRTDHKPGQLSGGQKQRVAIARALANRPSLVLADEPTGNLDSKTGSQIMNLLSELNQEGNTILMVTHDENLAQRAQRIINIKDGKILEAEK